MRRLSKNGPPVTNSASGRSRPNVEKAMSMSRLVLALMTLICSPMVPAAVSKKLTPVALPPGLARLATRPSLTGSSGTVKTMGIVAVAALAANAGAVPPLVTITATGRRTNSAASDDSRSNWFSAQRYSITAFSPSTKPASFRPWRNARRRSA
jgi:hypothetical protein